VASLLGVSVRFEINRTLSPDSAAATSGVALSALVYGKKWWAIRQAKISTTSPKRAFQ
jgi:hypothetical protein